MNTQIRRSTTNKVFGGVAGGIAEAFNWDPTLVRLGFIFLTLAHGGGVLLYLLLMLVLPKADAVSMTEAAGVEGGTYMAPRTDGNRVLGYLLLGVGAVMLASILHIHLPIMALGLIAAGWYLLRRRA